MKRKLKVHFKAIDKYIPEGYMLCGMWTKQQSILSDVQSEVTCKHCLKQLPKYLSKQI